MYPIARRKVWILESFLLLGTSEGGRQCRSSSMAAPILLILLRSRALALCLCLLIPVSLGFRRRFRFAATVWVFACGFSTTTIWTILSKWNTWRILFFLNRRWSVVKSNEWKTMKTSRFSNCKVLGLWKSVLSCSVNHGKNTWQRQLQPQRVEDCEIDLSATRDTSNELQLGGIMQQVDRVKSNYLKPDKLPFQRTPFFLPRWARSVSTKSVIFLVILVFYTGGNCFGKQINKNTTGEKHFEQLRITFSLVSAEKQTIASFSLWLLTCTQQHRIIDFW